MRPQTALYEIGRVIPDGHILGEIAPLAHHSLQLLRRDVVGTHQGSQLFRHAQRDQVRCEQSFGHFLAGSLGLRSRSGQDVGFRLGARFRLRLRCRCRCGAGDVGGDAGVVKGNLVGQAEAILGIPAGVMRCVHHPAAAR